jgi:hypothetical protein
MRGHEQDSGAEKESHLAEIIGVPCGSLFRDGLKAFPVKFEQMAGVFVRLCCCANALKAGTRASSATVASGHRDKFHQIQRNIFVAACSCRKRGLLVHENSPLLQILNLMIAKLSAVSHQMSALSCQQFSNPANFVILSEAKACQ